MQEPIQDNDNYKPHAKYYSNPSMFTQVIAQTRKCDGRTDGRPLLLYPLLLSRGDNNVNSHESFLCSHLDVYTVVSYMYPRLCLDYSQWHRSCFKALTWPHHSTKRGGCVLVVLI
jgi:hypothetical protein